MPNETTPDKARIIKANTSLQSKVGTGTIDDLKIQTMQQTMNEAKVDFGPMAKQFLDQLEIAIAQAKKGEGDHKILIAQMTEPVMQIKANAAMFNYQLVGNLGGIVLDFLENIDSIDKTVIDIVDAHYKTLGIIINNKMTGSGGDYGGKIEAELKDACKRYFAKKGIDPSAPR